MVSQKGRVPVPVSPEDVRNFVDLGREEYEQALASLRALLNTMMKKEPAFRSVYKLYSRGDIQGGDELKSAHKIRLKFNEHNLEKGVSEASLYDVPDIVGMTIVVSYPTEISNVASILDIAVDKRVLTAIPRDESRDRKSSIVSRHGWPIEANGYFACHYNVRLPGLRAERPICEIQIKTLLHDAWGAKTHDLTYKPTGRVGAELLTSFNLLGDNLANLDQQSDALRQSIVRTARVRETKRRKVQTCVLSSLSLINAQRIKTQRMRKRLLSLQKRISLMTCDTPDDKSQAIANDLLGLFHGQEVAVSTLIYFLSAMTQRSSYSELAREAIAMREQQASDPLDQLGIKLEGALYAFAAGDSSEAIDNGEAALEMMEAMRRDNVTPSNPDRFDRICVNILSNLAYFHADIIGSYDGDKRGSLERARVLSARSVGFYPIIGFPAGGIRACEDEIVTALKNPKRGGEAFSAFDNEGFVAIQIAGTETELRAARECLDLVYRHIPTAQMSAADADLAIEYHDYCARMRLSELESVFVP
jgi:ppGpp synthetase/RelA/SpoT-type nucleotidyltranferase